MKIIEKTGVVNLLTPGTITPSLKVGQSIKIDNAYGGFVWESPSDLQLLPSQYQALQLTSTSGDGSWLELRHVTSATPEPYSGTAALFGRNVSGICELFAIDEDLTEMQLTSHAQDAPEWLYDSDDPFPRVLREINYFVGKIRFTNASRMDRLTEMAFTGTSVASLPQERRTCIVVETFAEYNSRRMLPPEKQLVVRNWDEVEEKRQEAYDQRRADAIRRGEQADPAMDIRRPLSEWLEGRIPA